MKLKEFAGILPVDGTSTADIEISGLTSDSRKVRPGFMFAALKGSNVDGAAFAADAAARGAAAIMAAPGSVTSAGSVPVIVSADPRRALSFAAARFYGSQPKTMVAVTGTAGKTSVAVFARQVWRHAGYAAASIGTIGVQAPGRDEHGSPTTPGPVELHRLLAELAEAGVTHGAMEASSQGLDQRRLDGVKLSAGAFTNLGRDHMDYHLDMADYHRAKLRLFDTLLPKGAPAIVFADDDWSKRTEDAVRAAGLEVLTVGRKGAFIALKHIEHERRRQRAEVLIGGEVFEFVLPLAGDFQIANALVAAGLAVSTGTEPWRAISALETLEGAPGRLDLVGTAANGAPVYVDYAHKPDALRNVLRSVKPFTTGRVIVVFGCGGDRDRGKRPIMGAIADEMADAVIVTDDNPRTEKPEEIRAAILDTAPGAVEIGDRRDAIRHAVSMLSEGDTLIVAGKGHEPGQTVGKATAPFSDHEEVRAALAGVSE